jgi:hypothetical protein
MYLGIKGFLDEYGQLGEVGLGVVEEVFVDAGAVGRRCRQVGLKMRLANEAGAVEGQDFVARQSRIALFEEAASKGCAAVVSVGVVVVAGPDVMISAIFSPFLSVFNPLHYMQFVKNKKSNNIIL